MKELFFANALIIQSDFPTEVKTHTVQSTLVFAPNEPIQSTSEISHGKNDLGGNLNR
jgi:hypothetical protein